MNKSLIFTKIDDKKDIELFNFEINLVMNSDRAIFDLLEEEKDRQSNGIELIASENFTSPEVMGLVDQF